MTDESETSDLHPLDLTQDKRKGLLELFPEIRTEGDKIDFERLRAVLGETIDVGKERYGMTWPGKADCLKTIQTPSGGTLLPARQESVEFDTTEHLIIEGDNLEVLKLLQKAYLGKVKLIYIDPPYNTGNDFIYPDNYTESLQTYLEYTGQADIEGKKFGTNTEDSGRFHSRWLNMMYPRLYLAKNLLRDDGLLFVSMNDRERDNLKKLCDDVFGEESFIACFVWQSKKGGGSDTGSVVEDHEYVLAYANHESASGLSRIPVEAEALDKTDEKGDYRRGRELNKWGSNSRREDRPTMWFPITGPDEIDVFPIRNDGTEGRWRWGKKKMLDIVQRGDVEFEQRSDGTYVVYEKIRSTNPRYKPYRTFLRDTKTTADGSKEVKALFDDKSVFEFPKPKDLLKTIIEIGSTNEDDIVLDFFAGAGTTAHAVLESNMEDGGNRTFILVQLPEPCPEDSEASKAGYPNVAEITKERVRRVIKQLTQAEAGQLPMNGKSDRGFKVFRLAESNFRTWDASTSKDGNSLAQQLELHVEHIREGRAGEDILYEILLKSGFALTTPIERIEVAAKAVYSVADGAMLVCLEKELTIDVIRTMADLKPQRLICLDAGFAGNDQLKANAVELFKSKEIVFKTV